MQIHDIAHKEEDLPQVKDIDDGDGSVHGWMRDKNCDTSSLPRLNARAINKGYMCELERIGDTHFDDAEMHTLVKRTNVQ